jgi:hypothetical protein
LKAIYSARRRQIVAGTELGINIRDGVVAELIVDAPANEEGETAI